MLRPSTCRRVLLSPCWLVLSLAAGCASLLGIDDFVDRPDDGGASGSAGEAGAGAGGSAAGGSSAGGAASSSWSLQAARHYGGTGDDLPGGVALHRDSSTIVVAGTFAAELDGHCPPGSGGGATTGCVLTTADDGDPFIAGIGLDGAGRWTRAFPATGAAEITSLSSYAAVWAAGTFVGTIGLGPDDFVASDADLFVVQIDPTHGEVLGNYSSGAIGAERGARIAAHPGGALVSVNELAAAELRALKTDLSLSPSWQQTLVGAEITAVAAHLGTPHDFVVGGRVVGLLSLCSRSLTVGERFIAKLSVVSGECQWLEPAGGAIDIHAVAAGGDDSVMAAGTFRGSASLAGRAMESFQNGDDAFIGRLAWADGAVEWLVTSNAAGTESVRDLASEAGHTVVVGDFTEDLGLSDDRANGDSPDGYFAALDATGAVIDTLLLTASGEQGLSQVALGGVDRAAAVGSLHGSATFGSEVLGHPGPDANIALGSLAR